MLKPDKIPNSKNHKLPSLENKNECFILLKKIVDVDSPNGEWYNYNNKFENEYKKCISALKEEGILELRDFSFFKFTCLGYEIYDAGSYFEYSFKKNFLYFVIDALKKDNSLDIDNLLDRLKPSEEKNSFVKLISDSTSKEVVKLLFSIILKNLDSTDNL